MNEWESRWQEGRTGWDAGVSPPVLHEALAQQALQGGRVFIPGCGAGYDIVTFARHGYQAVGLDIAPTAAQHFKAVREAAGLSATQAQLVLEDFWSFAPENPFDLVWDYTFLCAIPPTLRAQWVDVVHRCLKPGGHLWMLIFPASSDHPFGDGPPFTLLVEQVEALLAGRFTTQQITPVTNSHPGREGFELFGSFVRNE